MRKNPLRCKQDFLHRGLSGNGYSDYGRTALHQISLSLNGHATVLLDKAVQLHVVHVAD